METVEIDAKNAMVKNRELVSSILERTAADCESRMEEKDTMVKVVVNLINQKN